MYQIGDQNPEIEFDFIREDRLKQQMQYDNKLNLEMLRVTALERQSDIQQLPKMSKDQIINYFDCYQLLPQAPFNKQQLTCSKKLKLIRNNGRVYFGQVQSRQMSGYGICVYSEGKLYQGMFSANKKQGVGIEFYSNGNLYMGQFQNNKKHGKGQYFWFNADSKVSHQFYQYYDGQWWGGLPDGKGVLQKVNGNVYHGTFKNGLKHGFGSQTFENGDLYKGQYANGLPEGTGEYTWVDGSHYRGDFKQGLRNGYGIWKLHKDSQSQRYQGQYSMDKKCGYGIYTWGNGWVYKGNFENDYREGDGQLFDGLQSVYKGEWKKGLKAAQYKNNNVKLSRIQIKSKQKQAEQIYVQIEQICQDVNKNKNTICKEYELLARPGFIVRKQKGNLTQRQAGNQKMEKNNLKQSQSTLTSRIGTSINRPISKATFQSARSLVSSRAH